MRLESALSVVTFLLFAPSAALAGGPVVVHEAQLLGHGDPVAPTDTGFARALAVSGDTAVVGAPYEGPFGGAYVYVRTGTQWTLQQRLAPPDVSSFFGFAVAIEGDTIIVGSYGVDGTADVFVRAGATWSLQQRLLPSDQTGAAGYFGTAVAIEGDTIVCGAPFDHPFLLYAGSAFVFVRSGASWSQQQQLIATDGFDGDALGASASIHGDTVVLGAPTKDYWGDQSGSAVVFVRVGSSWSQQQRLVPAVGTAYDYFGSSVASATDLVVISRPGSSATDTFVRSGGVWTEEAEMTGPPGFGGPLTLSGTTLLVGEGGNPGAASVFVRSGNQWNLQETLFGDGGPFAGFGVTVSVSGDTALVGQVGIPGDPSLGSAYVFVRSGSDWSEQQHVVPPDLAFGDAFGRSVAVSGDTALVGAPFDDTTGGANAGSAYVFVRTGLSWSERQKLTPPGPNFDQYGTGVALDAGTAAVLSYEGRVAVYVSTGSAWSLQQILNPAPLERFFSVSISGDTLAAGTPGAAAGSGAVSVFVRSGTTWTMAQTLVPDDPLPGSQFGAAVSLLGDRLLITRPSDSYTPPPGGNFGGSAYVFERTGATWTQAQRLVAADAFPGGQFGTSASLDTDSLAVGSVSGYPATGRVYLFVHSGGGWSQQQELLSAPGAAAFGSISISGDTLLVGAPGEGRAYVYRRAGTVWTEQAVLLPTAGGTTYFGESVVASGNTLLVGASYASGTGAVEAFREIAASDAGVIASDGHANAVPGLPLTYAVTVTDLGPDPGFDVRVTDAPPVELANPTWTCSASVGSTCTAAGAGPIDDVANVAVGGTLTYSLTGTVTAGATGSISNSAAVSPLAGVLDPNAANDTSTDTDTLTPVADLAVTKSDGQTSAVPGQALSYTITAANAGPSVAAGAVVTDAVPAALQGAAWTCSASGGSSCAASGSGGINDTVTALVGGSLTYTLTGTVDPAATLELANTASVAPPAGASDPAMANNSATDVDALPVGFPVAGELSHGYDRQHDLAALPGPVAAEDVFRIFQRPHASYEVLVDGVSADLGAGSGLLLERLASDASTVLQTSSPAGAGGSRSLRWMNALDQPVVGEFVRVTSAGCTTDCDAADVYRLKVRETAGFVSRFNNSGTQVTVLVLENTGDQPLDMDVRFWSQAGASLGGTLASLGPRQTYILNTSTIAPGSSGSITVGNTGRYGQLSGKAVAVEPATGFTFDTALELRRR